MNKVRDNSTVPPGGFWFYVHEDGYQQRSPFFNVLKDMVKAYKRENQQPIGLNFDEEFENNLCSHASPDACIDFTPPSLTEKAISLTNALGRHAASGFSVVSPTEFERRIDICRACNFFGGMNGLIKTVCLKCGCSKLKISWKTSVCPIGKW